MPGDSMEAARAAAEAAAAEASKKELQTTKESEGSDMAVKAVDAMASLPAVAKMLEQNPSVKTDLIHEARKFTTNNPNADALQVSQFLENQIQKGAIQFGTEKAASEQVGMKQNEVVLDLEGAAGVEGGEMPALDIGETGRPGEVVLEEKDFAEVSRAEAKDFGEMRTQEDLDNATAYYLNEFVNQSGFTQKALQEAGKARIVAESGELSAPTDKQGLEAMMQVVQQTELAPMIKETVQIMRREMQKPGANVDQLQQMADTALRDKIAQVMDRHVREALGVGAQGQHRAELMKKQDAARMEKAA